MTDIQKQLIKELISEGYRRLNSPKQFLNFGTQNESEVLLNDIVNHPHFYVLGCVMDRQIKAEKAWIIPYRIACEIKSNEFADFLKLDLTYLTALFNKYRYHRFNPTMAKCFYKAVQDIHEKYQDNAANIWINSPKSSDVVKRFDDFEGVGVKIANMAVNILVRDYKVPMSDYSTIDIPPDSQVKKFFVKYGFLRETASTTEIVALARQLSPEYPALLDIAWEKAREL